MISFKRALIAALGLLTMLFLLRSTHSRAPGLPRPSPTASEGSDAAPPVRGQSSGRPQGQAAPAWRAPRPAGPAQGGGQDSRQQALTDASDASLRGRLTYQFPYDVEGKFPGYIWQTWRFTPGSGEFDERFRAGEASWSEKHPGFVHEVITDEVAVHLLRHLYAAVPEVLEAYRALPLPVLKADFFRYLILLARGGIYSDIDTIALQSAPDWVPAKVERSSYGLVIGIEADPDRPDWAQWYSRRIQFCQWTIQAKPGHPVLREVVASITEETLRRKRAGLLHDLDRDIVELTGPALWTDKLFAFFNDPAHFDMAGSEGNVTFERFTGMTQAKKLGDVVILPITSFSPGIKTMGAGDEEDPMAFVKHDFEGTWKPESERHIGETY